MDYTRKRISPWNIFESNTESLEADFSKYHECVYKYDATGFLSLYYVMIYFQDTPNTNNPQKYKNIIEVKAS